MEYGTSLIERGGLVAAPGLEWFTPVFFLNSQAAGQPRGAWRAGRVRRFLIPAIRIERHESGRRPEVS